MSARACVPSLRAILSSFLALATLGLADLASAQVVEQVTDARTSLPYAGVLDDAGTAVFAVSSGDPLGTNPEHRFQIFRWDALTGAVTQVTFFERGVEPPRYFVNHSVSDDGQKLAFLSRSNPTGDNPEGCEEVFVMNADGTGARQLTNDSFPCGLSWSYRARISGNGGRVVFDSDADYLGTNPSHVLQIWIVDVDGANLRQLTQSAAGSAWPTISDAGQRIAFMEWDALGSSELYAIMADGTGRRQLTSLLNAELPEISGDGSWITFQTLRQLPPAGYCDSNKYNVAVVDWNATDVHRVANYCFGASSHPGHAMFPDITDDAQWVFYYVFGELEGIPDPPRVRKSPSDGSLTYTELTDSAAACNWPRSSGGGNRVAFLCESDLYGGDNSDRGPELHTASGTGTGHLQLTDGVSGQARHPDLTPDGSLVVFASDALPLAAPIADHAQIYRIAADGTGLARLTDLDGDCRAPAVSDDGTTVVFASEADPFGTNRFNDDVIFAIQSDGTGLRQLMPDPSFGNTDSGAPDIAGNGSVVVFESQADLTGGKPGPEYGLYKVAPDGSGLALLDTHGQRPRVDASGTWVAYEGQSSITRIRTDGTGKQAVPFGDGGGCPDISADGNRIVFVKDEELFLFDAVAGATNSIAPYADDYRCPSISADGAWVHYEASVSIRRVEVDSGVDRRASAAPCDSPSGWRPRTIASDAEAGRVVFVGDDCTPGSNPDRNLELFLIDLETPARIHVAPGADPTLVSWDYESGPWLYDVIRGDLAGVAPGAGTVDLGPVACLENDSPDNDTRYFEDTLIPAAGQVLFYLYRGSPDGAGNLGSYGQGSGGEERVPASGGCPD